MTDPNSSDYIGLLPTGELVEFVDGHTGQPMREFSHPALSEMEELEVHIRTMQTAQSALELMKLTAKGYDDLPRDMRWDLIEVALWESVILSYSRCFDRNGGYPIDPRSYLDDEALKLHQYVYHLRDKHVAHDINDFRRAKAALGVDAVGNIVAFHTVFTVAAEPADRIDGVARLISLSLDEFNRRKVRCGVIASAVLSRLSPREILELPIARQVVEVPADPLKRRPRARRPSKKP